MSPAGPALCVVDDFLDEATAMQIATELGFAWWQESRVINRDGLGDVVTFRSTSRHSETAQQEFFPEELHDLLATIEHRLLDEHALDPSRLEWWQAVRYPSGGHFDLHHDGGLFGHEPAGERRRTVLIYLSTPTEGGETVFPHLGRIVEARAGRLVFWDNLDADGVPDTRLQHRAMPVLSGHKTVLTTWERERPVRTGVLAPAVTGEVS